MKLLCWRTLIYYTQEKKALVFKKDVVLSNTITFFRLFLIKIGFFRASVLTNITSDSDNISWNIYILLVNCIICHTYSWILFKKSGWKTPQEVQFFSSLLYKIFSRNTIMIGWYYSYSCWVHFREKKSDKQYLKLVKNR